MKKLVTAVTTLILGSSLAAGAMAQDAKAVIEAVMNQYLVLWNAHDAGAITSMIYRLPETHPWSTKAGLEKEFANLRSQGYSHSDIQSVRGCITSASTGQVELRFTRLKTDGGFMPPKDRLSIYRLQKFPDGWKVIGMAGADPKVGMTCPPG